MQTGTTDGPGVWGCVSIILLAWIILAVAFPVVFGVLVYVALVCGVAFFANAIAAIIGGIFR